VELAGLEEDARVAFVASCWREAPDLILNSEELFALLEDASVLVPPLDQKAINAFLTKPSIPAAAEFIRQLAETHPFVYPSELQTELLDVASLFFSNSDSHHVVFLAIMQSSDLLMMDFLSTAFDLIGKRPTGTSRAKDLSRLIDCCRLLSDSGLRANFFHRIAAALADDKDLLRAGVDEAKPVIMELAQALGREPEQHESWSNDLFAVMLGLNSGLSPSVVQFLRVYAGINGFAKLKTTLAKLRDSLNRPGAAHEFGFAARLLQAMLSTNTELEKAFFSEMNLTPPVFQNWPAAFANLKEFFQNSQKQYS
jgi:hypothetical protein